MSTKEDRQILLDHLNERHTKGRRLTWSDKAPMARLQIIHRRLHDRYGWIQGHDHEEDQQGPLGPVSGDREPSGWFTGRKVVLKG